MIRNDTTFFYIDGRQAGEDPLIALPFPNQTDIFVGSTPLGQDHFDGCLSDLFIFSRSLSEEEIGRLYRQEYHDLTPKGSTVPAGGKPENTGPDVLYP